jgi:hypothetical protein
MSYEIVKDKVLQDAWRVEAIGPEGEVYVTVFFEPLAEERAKEYVVKKLDKTPTICKD